MKTPDGYYFKTSKLEYKNDVERYEKIKYALGELADMVRKGQ